MKENVVIDELAIQKNPIKVTLLANKRYVEDNYSDLVFQKGQITEIFPKDLRSKIIKKMIMDGILKLVDGTVNFKFKNAHVVANANEDVIHYKVKDDIFEKDLITGQTILLYRYNKEDIQRNEKIEEKKE